MDIVAAQEDIAIPIIETPTRDAFVPLLETHRAEIESIKRTTFSYGAADRQQLDIYYPKDHGTNVRQEVPVLFFIYGGGFVKGTRLYPPPYDLSYGNLGAFFANRGIVTIIPDYRLVPDVTFPEPVEDIRDAIAWTISNADRINADNNVWADFNNVFVLSHSAGSLYVSTLMLYPGLLPFELRSRIRGLLLTGGGYRFTPERPIADPAALMALFGSWGNVHEKTPFTLLERASQEIVNQFPDVIVMTSEREPEGVIPMNQEFAAALQARIGKEVAFSLMRGHNHISPHCALFTGQGEEWAEEVKEWIEERVISR